MTKLVPVQTFRSIERFPTRLEAPVRLREDGILDRGSQRKCCTSPRAKPYQPVSRLEVFCGFQAPRPQGTGRAHFPSETDLIFGRSLFGLPMGGGDERLKTHPADDLFQSRVVAARRHEQGAHSDLW
jgi:hypothetical protein